MNHESPIEQPMNVHEVSKQCSVVQCKDTQVMTKIKIVGKMAPLIRDTGPTQPWIDPTTVAEALGAEVEEDGTTEFVFEGGHIGQATRVKAALRRSIEDEIRERSLSQNQLAVLLEILPIGVEVLFARRAWSLDTTMQIAGALGLEVEFKITNLGKS